MKKLMVSSFKINGIFILILLLCLSCKKEENELNILKLADLNGYKITEEKLNDSTARVYGENSNYIIEGSLNLSNHSKQKWWKIKSKNSKDWVDIEYIYLDKQIENQIKIYKNGLLDKKVSRFYEVYFDNQGCVVNFHFPPSMFNIYKVDFTYILSDTISKKKIREGVINFKRDIKYSNFSGRLVLDGTENMIMGIGTEYSKFNKNDSVTLSTSRMYVKAKKE